MRAFILTPTYRLRDGVPEVHLYGVLESGEPCLIIDDRTRPYFFVRAADHDRAIRLAPSLVLAETDLRAFDDRPVQRATVGVPGDVPPLRGRLEAAGIECLEADVRFASRYLIDRGIRGSLQVEGASETQGRIGRVFRNPAIHPCQWTPTLKVLSIDIETDPRAEQVLSIALHCPTLSRVLIVHPHPLPHAEPVPSERELLRRFRAYLDELDPDIITGWNVAEFDLAVLARRARHYRLALPIGRTEDRFELRREMSYTREARAVTVGRLVLDGLSLLRGAFIRLQDYRLETAAQAILGRGKLIAGTQRADAILRAYQEDPEHFVAYNLEDARLVSEILARTGLIELAVERSLLTGMPLDRVSAAIASVDSLYLSDLRARGHVAPSVGGAGDARLLGGWVMDSLPGLYRNVLVYDFKSLYPSLIRTFNLDPLTLRSDASADSDAIVAPNGARFRRQPRGVLPVLVERLAAAREQGKREGRPVQANAIKILMNSLYGVLGASSSRLFSPAVANAITHFGQLLIKSAADAAQAAGYRVIYGDTDSLFIDSGEPDYATALAGAEALRRSIGDAVARVVRERYRCESFLELEFEKCYRRFFLPEVRSGKTGSKKRYAGVLVDAAGAERIEYVGLEAVRRDWSEVAKRFQRGLLERVFQDEAVDAFVRDFVADLRAGRHDDALAYRKAVRKDLSAYTATTPPHVRAARKLGEQAGRIVAYTMTLAGPEPLGEETAAPDYTHYLEHQLEPLADAILRFIGTDFATLTGAQRQLSLF
ncbi:MAG: DNA polymerase II [Deltaproteobacteria bacterium]|nr:DNA polymerase II [Deltaproteobacteria bacterium]